MGLSKTHQYFLESSKTHQSSLTLKGGSTSHLGLLPSGKKRKPLLLVARNHFILRLADHQRSTPAAELRIFVRDEPQGHTMLDACSMLMEPQGHTNRCLMLIARNLLGVLLMGTQGHNAGCGDDNTFYSTLDRIDSGEVPIRVMAEIL